MSDGVVYVQSREDQIRMGTIEGTIDFSTGRQACQTNVRSTPPGTSRSFGAAPVFERDDSSPSPARVPAHKTQADEDAQDIWDCSSWWPDADERASHPWLDEHRAAHGVEQARYSQYGRLTGATASSRNESGRHLVALHDAPISTAWPLFGNRIVGTEVLGWPGSWHDYEEGVAAWPELAAVESTHAAQMAAVTAGNARMEEDVDDPDAHTGMAPGAAIHSLVPQTYDWVVYTLWSPDLLEGHWRCDLVWERLYSSPAAVVRAAELGADVFVAAQSQYCAEAVYTSDLCGSDRFQCNNWTEHELVRGLEYASAIDDAFSDGSLQTFLSAGNNGRQCPQDLTVSPLDRDYTLGLGRSSYTAITVGHYPNWELDASTELERVAQLQEVGGVTGRWLAYCSDTVGPTGDSRQLPLLLGLSLACGVPASAGTTLGVSLGEPEGPYDFEEGQGYYCGFGGSSEGTAAIGGAYVVFKEWLTLAYANGLGMGILQREPSVQELRVHFLNMGDRGGVCTTGGKTYVAPWGLGRGGGFGLLRLRLLEPCHFGDGALEYHSWRFEEVGETFTVALNYDNMLGRSDALPAGLTRIKICTWFDLDAQEYASREGTSRPLGLLLLQVRGKFDGWETVAHTYSGQEYTAYEDSVEDGSSNPCRDVGDFDAPGQEAGYALSTPVVRDPHMSLNIDSELQAGPVLVGDREYRVLVSLLDHPCGGAIPRPHVGTLRGGPGQVEGGES